MSRNHNKEEHHGTTNEPKLDRLSGSFRDQPHKHSPIDCTVMVILAIIISIMQYMTFQVLIKRVEAVITRIEEIHTVIGVEAQSPR